LHGDRRIEDNGRMASGDRPEFDDLAGRVRARRRDLGVGMREAARQIGISAATLSRVERGGHLPDRENLFRFQRWLEPETAGDTEPREPHPPGASTMEAIELHLRADPDLASEDAEALARMMRLAYGRMVRR
jgi:transcriptional regulator with XRE-family HTH domain